LHAFARLPAVRLASFSDELAPFLAMEVMERGLVLERAGIDVVQLAVGEPDFAAPAPVVAEAVRALSAGETHYTESRGLHALCVEIARECRERRGVEIAPEQVIVTTGTSPALYMAMRLLLEPGDEVLLPTPHYPCYANMALTCGARPIFVPTYAEDGYAVAPAAVRAAITPRTRCIVLASPSNPTGAVQSAAVVQALCELGLPILSDEIYDGLLFDGARVCSPLRFTRDCFVFDGFSKRYAMTGFRLGYAIVPESCVRPLQSLQQNLHICASQFAQRAAVAALTQCREHVATMRAVYERRRGVLCEGLRALGFAVPHAPAGAFYVLAGARHLGSDSMQIALDLLARAHVGVAPGRDFGAIAEGHLRFSYATSEERIREGLARLSRVLA
jgi:aspartate/methionine/tyrosine aminotransferase